MSHIAVLLFLHILGAVTLFAVWGMEALIVGRLRRAATADEARVWIALAGRRNPLAPLAMVTILGTGIALMVGRWQHQAWTATALAALVAMGIVSSILARRARGSLGDAEAIEVERSRAMGEALSRSLALRISGGVGVLALMVAKPGWGGSLSIMAGAIAVGIGIGIGVRGSLRPGSRDALATR
jgi:hypothetical protein